MIKALDLSFNAHLVSSDWCKQQIVAGTTLLWGNAWLGNFAIQETERALRYWRESGGIIGAYYVVHDGRSADDHFSKARDNVGAEWENLAFIAIDVEIDPVSISTIQDSIDLVRKDLPDIPIAIYTGRWFWRQFLSNTDRFSSVPLIDASYSISPSLRNPGFGGWQIRSGHQYMDSVNINGINCDLSILSEEFIMPIPDINPELDIIWTALSQAQKESDVWKNPELLTLLEKAKQLGVVGIKKKLGYQQ